MQVKRVEGKEINVFLNVSHAFEGCTVINRVKSSINIIERLNSWIQNEIQSRLNLIEGLQKTFLSRLQASYSHDNFSE